MVVFGLLFSGTFGVWAALFFLVFFLTIGFIKEKKFEFISIFYSLYALLMNSFLGYIVAQPLEYLFSFLPAVPANYLFLVVAITPPLINLAIIYCLNRWLAEYSLKHLRQASNSSLIILSVVLVAVTLFLYVILTMENQRNDTDWWSNLFVLALFIVVILSLLFLNTFYQRQRKQEIQRLKDEQLIQLQEYTHYVETLYDEINHFKHDYINILTSLDESITKKNLDKIQQIYESVIKPTKQSFQTNDFVIARLSNIGNPEIKSVLSAKLLLAKQKNISIEVEVVEKVYLHTNELLNLVRIFSILFDNAIEAAEKTPQLWIRLALFEQENLQIIILENSSSELVNIKKIFDKGYSSKGLNRGIGLFSVAQMIDTMENIFIETSSEDAKFVQAVKIVKEAE